jgi:hypothetical protein
MSEHPGPDRVKVITLLGLDPDANIAYGPTKDSNPIAMLIQATVQVAIPFVRYNADGYSFFTAC